MPDVRHREEVLNVILAQLLHDRGVVSAPEQLLHRAFRPSERRMPDVLVTFQGLRTAIEGKVNDQPGVEGAVLQAARERVEEGIAHLSIALLYPPELRQTPFDNLRDELPRARLRLAICSEAGQEGWMDGDLDHLAELLRRTYDQLIREDVVSWAVQIIGDGVDGFADIIMDSPASVDRAADALGIHEVGSAREGEGNRT